MNAYLKEINKNRPRQLLSIKEWVNWLMLKAYLWRSQAQGKDRLSRILSFSLSVILRIKCMLMLSYVSVIMIHESDSWIPALNLIFCFGILVDLICFVRSNKEHVG